MAERRHLAVAVLALSLAGTGGAARGAESDGAPPEREADTARELAQWVVASADAGGLPFIVVDKALAQVFVYDADGDLQGEAPALLGLATGDRSAPGIGDKPLSAIGPGERTTPAGRFVSSYGPAFGQQKVLWIDYPTAISLHPVITSNPKERRLERLRTPSADDNRITYGCINVSAAFYREVVTPTLRERGIVYILPESAPLAAVFPAYQAWTQASAASDATAAQ